MNFSPYLDNLLVSKEDQFQIFADSWYFESSIFLANPLDNPLPLIFQ